MIFRKKIGRTGKPAFAFFAGIACLMGIGMGSVSCDVLDDPAVEGQENTEELARQAVSCVVSFNASFDEVYTKDETKSSAESCMRLKWTAGDYIWAYTKVSGVWTYAGKLTVAETGYTAKVSGELTLASESDLYLVHGTHLQEAPEISADGSITIDMSDQGGSNMVVAYGKIENVTVDGGKATVDEKVVFTFANSFIRINCYDLPYADKDGNIITMTFLEGMITDTNTKIGITFGDTVTVTGSDEGDITFSGSPLNSGSGGRGVAWVYVPPVASDSDRSVYVDCKYTSDSSLHEYKALAVAKSSHGAGELINTMAQFKEVEDYITNMTLFGGTVKAGETLQLNFNYEGTYDYSSSLVWTSSDPTVGTIDQNGLFTALKKGETGITLTGKYTYVTGFACYTDVTVVE